MRKSQPIEGNFNYQVQIQPLFSKEGNATCLKGTRRLDNGEFLGTCTESYGIVQNNDVISMVESVFNINGLGAFERQVKVARGGRRVFARYDFKDKVTTIPKVGDRVGLRLTAHNSFDGSSKLTLEMGLLRLRCTNGMTTMQSEFNMAKKHYLGLDVDSIKDALNNAMTKYSDIVSVFGEMSEINITQAQGETIINNLVKRNVLSERLSKNVLNIWEKPSYAEDSARTLYNLYNANTQYVTHEFEAEHFENAQKMNARLGSEFVAMTRIPSRLSDALVNV